MAVTYEGVKFGREYLMCPTRASPTKPEGQHLLAPSNAPVSSSSNRQDTDAGSNGKNIFF